MKILNKKEFLKLPQGIFFCKGVRWCFYDLWVKGESTQTDFYSHHLCAIDAFDGGEMADRHEDMLENGTSYPINRSEMRDGCFDDDDIFLIYEKEDLKMIKELMERAMDIK